MLEILISPHGELRRHAARQFVAEAGPAEEVFLVGAPRDSVDDLVRERTKEGGATFGLHRLTIGSLAARLAAAELAAQGRGASSGLGAVALAARAVFRALTEARLSYFAPVARAPSFARAVSATLEELRRAGVRPERLAGLGRGGADLSVLLTLYEEELEAARIADRTDLYRTAARILGERPPASMVGRRALFLDVPITSRAELAFIRAFVARSARCRWTVAGGDAETLAALQSLPHRLTALDGDGAAPIELGSLEWLQERLFDSRVAEAAPADGRVELFSAPGEGREAVEIARRLLAHAERGVPFDEMAVFVRAPATYLPALESALARAGIPAAFADGVRRPHPSGRALSALLACAAERLSAARFCEYLSLGQAPAEGAARPAPAFVPSRDELMPRTALPVEPPRDGGARPASLPVRRWEQLLTRASIVEGSPERWERRLAGLGFEVSEQAKQLERIDPESPYLAIVERDRADLEALSAFALPLIGALASLPAQALWGEWLERLEELATLALASPELVLSVLAELHPMAGVGPVEIDEVEAALAPRLLTLSIPPPKHRYGRVYVATPEHARGRSFRVVFVPGLAERVFPEKLHEDPLLLDDARSLLDEGLSTQADRAARERLKMRIAIGAAREHLVVSYSRLEMGTSRARVPSLYALEVVRSTTGALPDVAELQRDAAQSADASLAWPAPRSPDDAIDETEHDLATLRGLLREPADGRARYLLHLNPHLARSLRARWSRWHSESFTPEDGLVCAPPAIRDLLADERLTARARSVSSLQKYAACPYRFYLSAILHLAPAEDRAAGGELDPLTRGSLFHRVQRDTMRELRRIGGLPVTQQNLAAAIPTLDAVLSGLAEDHCDRLRPAAPRVFWDEIAEMRSDLLAWLAHVADSAAEWEPLELDLAFGLSGASHAAATVDGTFRVHGAIDAIERSKQTGALRVTDFKTGADHTSPGWVVGGGELLQPVVYSLALESLLGATGAGAEALRAELGVPEGSAVGEARLFFCTSRGAFAERTVVLDPTARTFGLRVLSAIDRAIESGFFPALPRADACGRCSFRSVCGPHEEARIKKKRVRSLPDPDRYRELCDIRSLP